MARVPYKASGKVDIPLFTQTSWHNLAIMGDGFTLVKSSVTFQLSNFVEVPPGAPNQDYVLWQNGIGAVTICVVFGETDPGPPDVYPVEGPYGDFVLRDGFNFCTDATFLLPTSGNPPNYYISVRSITDSAYISKGMRLVPPGLNGWVYLGFEVFNSQENFGIAVSGVAMYDLIILNPPGIG